MPRDDRETAADVADVALAVWQSSRKILTQPRPQWHEIAASLENSASALTSLAAEARAHAA